MICRHGGVRVKQVYFPDITRDGGEGAGPHPFPALPRAESVGEFHSREEILTQSEKALLPLDRQSSSKGHFSLATVSSASLRRIFYHCHCLLVHTTLGMASSKSSQTTCNIVIALLALWSVISLIIIVVWATSPDLKGASQCRAELQAVTEKLEGVKVMSSKDKEALEEKVLQGWVNQTVLNTEIGQLLLQLNLTNSSLNDCEVENDLLRVNISLLETEIEELERTQLNLTRHLTLQQDHIENLQLNLTVMHNHAESCEALRTAAESHQVAAESQKKACESSKHYIQKQYQRPALALILNELRRVWVW
ncbi:hypothetical protein GJAV_G00075410 [Gymnothorax javanicus]|nr:hypothetical protein GJAV_G00075410 [Gymnothorax javanicus]